MGIGNIFARQPADDDPHDLVGNELDAIFLESVFPVSIYLAGLFALFAVLHPLLLPHPFGAIMAALAVASCVACLAIGFLARSGWIEVRSAYIAGFVIAGIGLLNSAVHMRLIEDIDQSSNFALVFVAVGLFFLSRRRLAIAYVITFSVWISLAVSIADNEDEFAHFAIMNVQAMVIGVLAQSLRVGVHRRLIRMRADAYIREEKLAEALEQARLYAAAERENKAKTEFLANMSHELRTPLNAMLGFSEIMVQEMFGPLGNKKYKEYLGDILDAGRHLLSLVNDILDLSRIQLDTKSLNIQPVELASTCENCLSIVRERAERSNVRLSFQHPAALPAIETDARRLKQILINLLSNAIKFTPPGGSVTVDIEQTPTADTAIRICDTGIGMSEEDIRNACKPFWQADAGLDRTYDGTGLGLALVKELSEALHARFILESKPGAGTVATIFLPPSIASLETEAGRQAAA